MSIQRLSNAGQSGYRYKTLIAGITPVASVPVIGDATALTYSTASVAFTAPGSYAGATYTATSSPGGFTGTSASSPITVSGLSEQTAYTFTVTATNATGTSGPSAASNSITTPAAWAPEGGFDALANITLSAAAGSVSFTSIPAGYKHLQIRAIIRGSASATLDAFKINFNGDSSSSYIRHALYGNGSSANSIASATSATYASFGDAPAASATANFFGGYIVDILDYANTNKNKTLRAISGYELNGSSEINLRTNLWMSTAALTSLAISTTSGSNIAAYSSFALYGVK